MKTIIIILILSIFSLQMTAQYNPPDKRKNTLYVEAPGLAGYGSLNYERVIYNISFISFGLRAGVGTYKLYDFKREFNPDIIIPVTLSAMVGRVHILEFGGGEVITSIPVADFSKSSLVSRNVMYNTCFLVGYRYHCPSNGFMFRVTYSPIIENNNQIRQWGGLSLGYRF